MAGVTLECLNCPYKSICLPNVIPKQCDSIEDFCSRLLDNARMANITSHKGFGRPLKELYYKSSAKHGWNCVEYSRAVVYSIRHMNNKESGYLLWVDNLGNTHLSPVITEDGEEAVCEQGCESYWAANFSPVAVFNVPPLHYSVAKISREGASSIPVVPLSKSVIVLEDLGFGKVVDGPQRFDTGVSYVYQVRVDDVFGFLVWFYTDDVLIISRNPRQFIGHINRARIVDTTMDMFRP